MMTTKASAPRIYDISNVLVGSASRLSHGSEDTDVVLACEAARSLGFDSIAFGAPSAMLAGSSEMGLVGVQSSLSAAADMGLGAWFDISLDSVAGDSALVAEHDDWFISADESQRYLDPRHGRPATGNRLALRSAGRLSTAYLEHRITSMAALLDAGAAGFRLMDIGAVAADDWRVLVERIKASHPHALLAAWTPGLAPHQLDALQGIAFDFTFGSLPWWDYRSEWLFAEYDRLSRVAPVIGCVAALHDDVSADGSVGAPTADSIERALWTAAQTADGLLVSAACAVGEAAQLRISTVNRWLIHEHRPSGRLHRVAAPDGSWFAFFRHDPLGTTAEEDDSAADSRGALLLVNSSAHRAVEPDARLIAARLPNGFVEVESRVAHEGTVETSPTTQLPITLPPGGAALLRMRTAAPVLARVHPAGAEVSDTDPLSMPRIAIESITPVVDHGRFPVKRVVGDTIDVEADVFMDGHDRLAVALHWRALDEPKWQSVRMRKLPNDRWQASFTAQRVGGHEFQICAWRDEWESYRDELGKKHAAGLDVSLEVEEGRLLVAHALKRANDTANARANRFTVQDNRDQAQAVRDLTELTLVIGTPVSMGTSSAAPIPAAMPEQIARLLADDTAATMAVACAHPFETFSPHALPVWVDRQAAQFASWYELFPRSQSGDANIHGTFDDVIKRLPAIRDMGFDVLYFPPIHPIGLKNRKGKNNSLNALADQPGSPYAIGSADGGHDAIHPELGTVEDFHRLVAAAREHGLEIALDFAIQCSPDHPWLKDHPEWFAWRADGSMRYAENPPKKYEDIVNVDFYSTGASPAEQLGLWEALRDVILYWTDHGVRTFRVDNPHTKPLPFWEWMISEVQSQCPDALFLSEAFTRPKMMYRLAKVGFSQSYTYFTWRENKDELVAYMEEINTPPVSDEFRPNFFVNTPDINPRFLQRSGRPGFLIRMALATTTSGLWGMYSGFELCEGRALPGKEEYLDSEKYEVVAWDWNRPGNIIAEMTQMNRLRRDNPALQTHLGFQALVAHNDRIMYFMKSTPARDNVVLVAITLDPFEPQSAAVELPVWTFGLPDDGALQVDDLINGGTQTWHGKQQFVSLTPDRPYAVWRLRLPQ